jgi:hypothetical protein
VAKLFDQNDGAKIKKRKAETHASCSGSGRYASHSTLSTVMKKREKLDLLISNKVHNKQKTNLLEQYKS